MPNKPEQERIGLPARVFFYTVDQVATLLEMDEKHLRKKILFYEGRDPGICPKTRMRCVNIMPEGETPEWRISENSLLGYLRHKGIKFYSRGYVL